MNYNAETLKRYAERLEEQMSNFQVATDKIDYDFRDMCDILKKYDLELSPDYIGGVNRDDFQQVNGYYDGTGRLSSQANQYGDVWQSVRTNAKYEIIKLAAAMIGFYDFSKKTSISSGDEIKKLVGEFSEYYSGKSVVNGVDVGTPKNENRDTSKLYWAVSKAVWKNNGTWTGPDYDSIDTSTWTAPPRSYYTDNATSPRP